MKIIEILYYFMQKTNLIPKGFLDNVYYLAVWRKIHLMFLAYPFRNVVMIP